MSPRRLAAGIAPAGLSRERPYEAAEIDGASKWQVFWEVVLPLARLDVALQWVIDRVERNQITCAIRKEL